MDYKKKCKKCGYIWKSFLDKPKQCPNCKRNDWDKTKKIQKKEKSKC